MNATRQFSANQMGSSRRAILALLLGSSLGGCGEYRQFGNRVNQADKDKLERRGVVGLLSETQTDGANGKGVSPSASARPLPDCELTLRLSTWDNKVGSERICIKGNGRPIEIPSKIALTTQATDDQGQLLLDDQKKVIEYRANPEVYCENLSELKTTGQNKSCIWNRKFYDNHPMDFILSSNGTGKLSSKVSLVRAIRNGRAVYTWKPVDGGTDPSELRIEGRTLAESEYFNEPVDIGLYILSSGADEAKAAVARTTLPATLRWQTALGGALRAAAKEAPPPEVTQLAQCLEHKLEYMSALAQEMSASDDTARAQAKASAVAALNSIARQADRAQRIRQATPLSVATVVTGVPDTNTAAPKTIGDTQLTSHDIVGFLDAPAQRLWLMRYASGKAWQSGALDEVQSANLPDPAPPDVPATPREFLISIAGGPHQGDSMLVSPPTSGADALTGTPVQAVSITAACTSPAVDLQAAHDDYEQMVSAALGDATLRQIGKLQQAASDLGKKLGVSATDLQTFINSELDKLSANAKKRLSTDVGWLRQMDQELATVIGAAQAIAQNGADVEAAVKSSLHDPAAQLRGYQAAAAALPTDATLYSKAVANPAPGSGEETLPMTFLRPRQKYYLLAWNAVPIAIKNPAIKTELRLENLIPIIDLVGWHWQTGLSVVSVGGLGLGVIGTRESVYRSDGTTTVSNFNVGPQANVSAAGFRIGMAYLFHHAEDCSGHSYCFWASERNVRFLIGADIVRLITGKDTAVATDQSNDGQKSDTD